MFSVAKIRQDFPILSTGICDCNLIYLDNAATTQVPVCVLEKIRSHYLHDNANVHRGIHTLSERSTHSYEEARKTVRAFLKAESEEEIIFTQGVTDSINTVAEGLRAVVKTGDTVVVTELEHHSNFLPWQRLCRRTGAEFKVIPCPDGNPDMDAFRAALRLKPKLVAVTQVSNLTGTVMPLAAIIALAHDAGAMVLVDGAQGMRHCHTNVVEEDIDFYCFSGHKVMGPAGIGVLYAKRRLLERLEPFRVGGGMVDVVTNSSYTEAPYPYRFEAGTPNYPGAVGLAEALRYIDRIGRHAIAAYENELTDYAADALLSIEGLHILGHPDKRAGIVSFTLDNVHPYDASSILDKQGVAVRSGSHCAQPALKSFGISAALRLSVAFYNTKEEIQSACRAIRKTMEMLNKWTRT